MIPGAPSLLVAIATCALAPMVTAADTWFVRQGASGAATGQNWQDAFTDLQAALAVADSGDQIWVAAGTYRPDEVGLDVTKVFSIPAGVSVYGGFVGSEVALTQRDPSTNETKLDGDLLQDDLPDFFHYADNSRRIVVMEGVGAPAVLDGFTIRGGYGPDTLTLASDAGGVSIKHGKALVASCTFVDNKTGPLGSSGAMTVRDAAEATVVACRFTSNRAPHGNGAALNVWGGAKLTAIHCRIANNQSGLSGGAVNFYEASGTMANCLLSDNRSGFAGGAISISGSAVDLVGCTVAHNQVSLNGGGGGGVSTADPGPVRISNCVIWGNVVEGVSPWIWYQLFADTETTLTSCCLEPPQSGFGGTNLIFSDPLFVDPLGPDLIAGTPDDDFRLGPGSSCIDAGSNQVFVSDMLDFDGDGDTAEPMPVDGLLVPRYVEQPSVIDLGVGPPPIVDIGAYEYSGWTNLGHALQGAGGVVPCATGGGDWIPGRDISLDLRRGPPGALAFVVLSSSIAKLPFRGGVLVPAPEEAFVTILDGQGHALLSDTVPTQQPLGSLIVLQAWFLDPGAPLGASAAPAFSGLVHP